MMLGRVYRSILFFVFLLPGSVLAAEAAGGHEGGSSMPQLDPTYYLSQLFWLFIAAVTLYVLMAKVALPRVSRMVDLRDLQVQRDLEAAYKLKQEAENLKINYTRALRDADEKTATRIDKAVKELRDKHNVSIEQSLERANATVTEAEQNLRRQKDAILAELDALASKLSASVADKIKKKA